MAIMAIMVVALIVALAVVVNTSLDGIGVQVG